MGLRFEVEQASRSFSAIAELLVIPVTFQYILRWYEHMMIG